MRNLTGKYQPLYMHLLLIDSVGIAILYKTLNKMLPKGHSEEHGEYVLFLVFSIDFRGIFRRVEKHECG